MWIYNFKMDGEMRKVFLKIKNLQTYVRYDRIKDIKAADQKHKGRGTGE